MGSYGVEERRSKNFGKTRKEIVKLDISDQYLEGDLNLVDFVNLRELDCGDNYLTSLNISDCSQLQEVYCSSNQLTNLDVSNNNKIIELDCSENQLTNLNVSNCLQLEEIDCGDNLLVNIALPANLTNLKKLGLNDNNFPEQDLSFLKEASNLEELSIGNERN